MDKTKVIETKVERTKRRTDFVAELREEGFQIKFLTSYQFRVNNVLDIYPTNARFHDLVKNTRGSFHGKNLSMFVREYLKTIKK